MLIVTTDPRGASLPASLRYAGTSRSTSCKLKCFTLIELLVVVAVISLLASILMPALGKVREMMRSTLCAANLCQVHLASICYANDYNGRLFSSNPYPGGMVSGNWPYVLANGEYLDGTSYGLNWPPPQEKAYTSGGIPAVPPHLYCPSDPMGTQLFYAGNGNYHQSSYAVAMGVFGFSQYSEPGDPHYTRWYTKLHPNIHDDATSEKAWFIEVGYSGGRWTWGVGDLVGLHNGTGNITFGDGHIKKFSVPEP